MKNQLTQGTRCQGSERSAEACALPFGRTRPACRVDQTDDRDGAIDFIYGHMKKVFFAALKYVQTDLVLAKNLFDALIYCI